MVGWFVEFYFRKRERHEKKNHDNSGKIALREGGGGGVRSVSEILLSTDTWLPQPSATNRGSINRGYHY